jgi:hypothetical protein
MFVLKISIRPRQQVSKNTSIMRWDFPNFSIITIIKLALAHFKVGLGYLDL